MSDTKKTETITMSKDELNALISERVRIATSKAKYKNVVYNSTLKSDMHIALTSEIKSLMIANKDKLAFIESVTTSDDSNLNIIRVTDEFKTLVRNAIIKIVS